MIGDCAQTLKNGVAVVLSRTFFWVFFLSQSPFSLSATIYVHSLDTLLFKGGGANFNYLPWRQGDPEKFLKWGGSMVLGQVFLKGGGRGGGGVDTSI